MLSQLEKNKQFFPPDFYTLPSILAVYFLLFFLRPKEGKRQGEVGKKKKKDTAENMGEGSTQGKK